MKLEAEMAGPMGILLSHVSDIAFMLEAGFHVTTSDITAEEFILLKVLHAERAKYEAEAVKRG